MTKRMRMIVALAGAMAIFGSGAAYGANKYKKPASIIHVVTLYWKDGVTEEQKAQVWKATEKMASEIPGITNLWLRSIKVQGDADGKGLTTAFVMEFKDEAAFKAYGDHPAHKAWEKVYIPLRGESRTHDITN